MRNFRARANVKYIRRQNMKKIFTENKLNQRSNPYLHRTLKKHITNGVRVSETSCMSEMKWCLWNWGMPTQHELSRAFALLQNASQWNVILKSLTEMCLRFGMLVIFGDIKMNFTKRRLLLLEHLGLNSLNTYKAKIFKNCSREARNTHLCKFYS